MKNGSGKFFYLDKGQLYEGMWVDDLAKCGQMKDWNRDAAPDATQFPLPPVSIATARLRGVATAGDTEDASPVRPTMSPYIKMTTDSLSSELTFDE